MKATETKPWLKYYNPETIKREYPELSIVDYFLWRNTDRMEATALSYYDNKITIRQMYEYSCRTANAFASIGVKDGDVVVVVSACTPEIVYTFYGLSLIGAASDMVDPRYSADGIKEYIEEVNAKFVVTLDVAYEKVIEAIQGTEVEKVVVLSPSESLPFPLKPLYRMKNPLKKNMPENFMHWGDFYEQGKNFEVEYIHDRQDRCCVIVHTGGTTGRAKSVMLSDRNINHVHFQYWKSLMADTKTGDDKFLNVMPPFIAYGLGYGVHLPICSGMASVIIPQLDPNELAKLVLKYKPADIAGAPSHIQVMMRDKRMKNADLSFFKNCCVGGDAISLTAEQEANEFLKSHNAKWKLTKGYGMTELAAVATACMLDVNRLGSVGIPHADFLIAAFDTETGEECDIGVMGELCVHGPTMMMGYYNNPEETDNIIRTHADGLKWVHTGDLGYIDEDGFVFISGRIKRVIIRCDGFKVYPIVVEDAISSNKNVEVCAVVGAHDTENVQGQVPVAFVKLRPECSLSDDEVRKELFADCKKGLAEYQQPADIHIVKELEYTPIGKIDFKKMEEMAEKFRSAKS